MFRQNSSILMNKHIEKHSINSFISFIHLSINEIRASVTYWLYLFKVFSTKNVALNKQDADITKTSNKNSIVKFFALMRWRIPRQLLNQYAYLTIKLYFRQNECWMRRELEKSNLLFYVAKYLKRSLI